MTESFVKNAKNALSLFGSTSPSYLILESLDILNPYLNGDYRKELACFINDVKDLKTKIKSFGYDLLDTEPIKITVNSKSYGYYGNDLADEFEKNGIVCEFSDKDTVVLMLTPQNQKDDLKSIENSFRKVVKKEKITEKPPSLSETERVYDMDDMIFVPRDNIKVSESIGKIFADFNITCPPAVSVIVPGERIDKDVIDAMKYYGKEFVYVLKH